MGATAFAKMTLAIILEEICVVVLKSKGVGQQDQILGTSPVTSSIN